MQFTLIMKNLRLILLVCALVCGGLLLWQYIRTQVVAKTSQADAQAAKAALTVQTKATSAGDKAVLRATEAHATINSQHSAAIKQAGKAAEKDINHEWAKTPVPPDMLDALNSL